MNKLETLVEVLQVSEVDDEIIKTLIVNYYNKPNSILFETDTINYRILSPAEQDDLFEEIAENKLDDIIGEIEDSILRKPYIYTSILGCIDRYNAINAIRKSLDVDDIANYFDETFLIEEGNYSIYTN